ncbi:MAG: NUDIX domain-containing protein [Bacteroidales bacterium]|nr:NUDIX domain-containing protein [Bacteroidales bacterium]
MVQRYTVFLNEKTVLIGQDMNLHETMPDEMVLHYTDKASLLKAYKRFYLDEDCLKLIIKTNTNFPEACKFFNEMFTRIEAAGGIVRNQKEEYLFIKRLGVWDLPKGKLHKKEPVQAGALREVTEETGLANLTIAKQLPSTYHIYTDRKGKEILKETYWFEMFCKEDQKLVPQLEEDITEVRWFSAGELNIPLNNTYASLRLLLESYLKD